MKYARTYKAVMNRVKKKINKEIFGRACAKKMDSTNPKKLTYIFFYHDCFKKEECEMEYLQSGDATKMTFEQWRIREIYKWGFNKKTIDSIVGHEMFWTEVYIDDRKEKLTKEQKQELQNAIDDLRFYLD